MQGSEGRKGQLEERGWLLLVAVLIADLLPIRFFQLVSLSSPDLMGAERRLSLRRSSTTSESEPILRHPRRVDRL